MRRFGFCLAISVFTLLVIASALAQQTPSPTAITSVPNLIRYGGTLKDAQGGLVASATTGVTFTIYKQPDGGAAIWMETQNVTTDAAGNYSVLLGSTTSTGLPGDLFAQQEQRWLGVEVQGEAEQPRVLLVSVPYAFKAHDAETLGGKSVSDFVLSNSASSAANGSSTVPTGTSTTGKSQPDKPGTKTAAASAGPTNFSGSTTDQIVGVTQSGTGAGVNATAPNDAIQGTSTATNGYGVHAIATGKGGFALLGESRAGTGGGIGIKASSSSTAGTGIRGIETATSGATTGISALVNSPAGTAAVFNNAGGGKIVSGQNNGVEKFSVDGSGNVNAAGAFTGSGSGLAGIQFSQLVGTLASSQFSGTYSSAATLSNTSNVYYGNGSNLTGVVAGAGSPYYIQNGTSQQANAYFNISGTGSANFFNAATGYQIGGSVVLSTLASNLFVGAGAGSANTSGNGNTFIGDGAGSSNTTGGFNVYIGPGTYGGGDNRTGSDNVFIWNPGEVQGESGVIRIGQDTFQFATFIAGIYGVNVGGVPVQVTGNGQLGVQTSSRRFKEQIRDMGDNTSALMKLRPVTFFYKPEYAKGDRTLQYGLIAEEVAQIYPELVAYDNDGKPYTVRYQYLASMLLNEVQKQYRRAEEESQIRVTQQGRIESQQQQISAQQTQIKAQQQEIENLKQQLQLQNASLQERLSRLESAVGTRLTVAEK
ncbi:MAG: tail fiber domain-containing protein [Candidatus Korobacteraceae bacterium]